VTFPLVPFSFPTAFEIVKATSDDQDLVILSDWHGSDSVSLSQVLGKVGTHQSVADMGWSLEMGSSVLSALACYL
jgi:hypothetical protein